MTRILLLSPAFPPARGGIERTAGELAAGLAEHRLEVVAGRPEELDLPGARLPTRVHWARNTPPYGRRATAALLRRAVAVGVGFAPDLVLCMHIRTMPAARALRYLRGSRTLLVVHAKEMTEQPALARAAVGWADGIVAVSSFSRRLASQAGAGEVKIRVIHPGVSLPLAAPAPVHSRSGPPTVLTVARMDDHHKGHDVAIEALALLSRRMPEVRWVMVGAGALRVELIERCARAGMADRVTFTGAVDDKSLRGYLATAHAFCLPNRIPAAGAAGEGFGIAFVEAGAYGLPVIACRVPGVTEAVIDGTTGILVEPESPEALADALEQVLSDGRLAEALGRAGTERAARLGWPAVLDRYRAVIGEVLGGARMSGKAPDRRWVGDLLRGPGRGVA